MKLSRRDLEWVVSEGVISRGQAEALWWALEGRDPERPRYDLPHVAYYFGALVVISAMGWFMTLGWERFGGRGNACDITGLRSLLRRRGESVVAQAGSQGAGWASRYHGRVLTPLAVYGFER